MKPLVLLLALTPALHAVDLTPAKKTRADNIDLPSPAVITGLQVEPKAIHLVGADDTCQLIVTGTLALSRLQDLSGDVKYQVADPQVASITPSGRIIPLANGSTTITA